ncbi:MAG TPA: hypothetical protein VFK19_04515 [Sphingomicrobium sp.]|nr:hypothetical protein [Sphingomicrobium sp.]
MRRQVVVPARMRMGAFWSDACILNVSSRGLMIRASRAAQQGSVIEVWRGDLVIVARVVWRSGVRAGLQAEDRVPVEEIMMIGQSPSLQLIAGERPSYERRKRPRTHEQSRFRAKALEFASVAAIAACLAGAAAITMEKALARPLAMVSFALGN